MTPTNEGGQSRLTTALVLVGLIVAGVWIWKRLPPATQDEIADRAVPVAVACLALAFGIGWIVGKVRTRRRWRERRERLVARFEREASVEKKRELAFALIELNEYRPEGLERVAPDMERLFVTTLRTALDDKQHRIRGMAASHLGVLQATDAIPLLIKALEDEHAYVRSCAALALGRMRAREAKTRLQTVMQEDWDQTVRSRAREALERIS
jgi:hypothetical protein